MACIMRQKFRLSRPAEDKISAAQVSEQVSINCEICANDYSIRSLDSVLPVLLVNAVIHTPIMDALTEERQLDRGVGLALNDWNSSLIAPYWSDEWSTHIAQLIACKLLPNKAHSHAVFY